MTEKWKFDTNAIHGGLEPEEKTGATTTPIYQTAGFAHDTAEDLESVFGGKKFGYLYSRISNPTVDALEKRFNALEKGLGAVGVSSGMASISTTIFSLAVAGDHIIVSTSIFGGTYYLIKGIVEDHDISVTYVDPTDTELIKKSIKPNTRLVFIETVGNPKLDVPDISAIHKLTQKANIPLVVDSTVTTPFLFDPKKHGGDILLYATTKYLSGSGSTVGGMIVDMGTVSWKKFGGKSVSKFSKTLGDYAFIAMARKIRSNLGCNLSPFNAFLTGLGVDTLSLRMTRHCENAVTIATALDALKSVESVNYPGLKSSPFNSLAKSQFNGFYGALLTVRLGTKERAFSFINAIKIAKNLANIGDTKTLVIHPLSTIFRDFSEDEAEKAGVYPDLVRVSVGLEDPEDIINDFKQALSQI